MCGIAGVFGTNLHSGYTKPLTNLMYILGLRGLDSSGVFRINNNDTVDVFKKAIPIYEFLPQTKAKDVIKLNDAKALVAHNRAATKGKINNKNAHPFIEDHIVLVHNGSLFDHEQLIKSSVESDSQTIARSIAQKGIKETVENLRGSFSLVFLNKKANTLNFIRNSQRPMFLMPHKHTDTTWFVSEKEMLELALARNNYPTYNFIELKPYTLYTYDLNASNIKNACTETKLEKTYTYVNNHSYRHRDFYNRRQHNHEDYWRKVGLSPGDSVPFVPYSFQEYRTNNGYGYVNGYQEGGEYSTVVIHGVQKSTYDLWMRHTNATIKGEAIHVKPSGDDYYLITLDKPIMVIHEEKKKDINYVDAHGNALSKKEWHALVDKGCQACGKHLTPDTVEWWLADTPLCNSCFSQIEGSFKQ